MTGKLSTGFVSLAFSQLVFLVSGYIIHFWLGRRLGPAGYGTYGVILYLLSLVTLFLTSGVPEAVSKRISGSNIPASSIIRAGLKVQLLFSFVIAILFYASSGAIARSLHDLSLAPYLRLAAFSVPLVALYAITVNVFNGLHLFRRQGIMIATYGIARLILIIGFVYAFHLWGAVWGFILAPIVVIAFAAFGFPDVRHGPRYPTWSILSFAFPVIFFTVALNTFMNLDLFVVKSLVQSEDAIGFYTAASTIARVPYFVFSTLGMVLLPVVSGAFREDRHEEATGMVRDSIRLVFLLVVPLVAIAAALSKPALAILYSSAYTSGFVPLSLLLIASAGITLFYIISYALNGAGRPWTPMLVTLLGVAVDVPLLLYATSHYGITGAATVSLVISFLLIVFIARPLWKHFGSVISFVTVAKVLLTSLAVSSLAFVVKPSVLLAPFLALALVIVYFLALYFMKELSRDDIDRLIRILPGRPWGKRNSQSS